MWAAITSQVQVSAASGLRIFGAVQPRVFGSFPTFTDVRSDGVGSGRTAALLRRSPLRTGLERFPFIRLKQAPGARWRIAVPNHVRCR
jgi:hypothetical protein